MNRRQKVCLLIMVFAVTGLFTAFYINTLTIPEEMIDLLFANKSCVSARGGEPFLLSQDITYEITPVGNNTFEAIGVLDDAKVKDRTGFGFRIYWNGTIPSERIFLAIALIFPRKPIPGEGV